MNHYQEDRRREKTTLTNASSDCEQVLSVSRHGSLDSEQAKSQNIACKYQFYVKQDWGKLFSKLD
jgi:hypothetical protein